MEYLHKISKLNKKVAALGHFRSASSLYLQQFVFVLILGLIGDRVVDFFLAHVAFAAITHRQSDTTVTGLLTGMQHAF